MQIIIKGKNKLGKTRSEQEKNLRKEWGSTMTDEQLSKMEYMEKVIKDKTGSKNNFIKTSETSKVK